MAPRRHILRELIADPVPMGLFAFATVTLVNGSMKAGWYTANNTGIYQIAFWWGGLGMFLAGFLDLLRGSGVTGSAFTAFGLQWMLDAMQLWSPAIDLYEDPAGYRNIQGWYYLCFTIIAIGATVGLSRVSFMHIVLLVLVDCIYFMDAINSWKPTDELEKVIGYFCVVAAALAFYLGLAAQWEEAIGIRLPILPRQPRPLTAGDLANDGGYAKKQDV